MNDGLLLDTHAAIWLAEGIKMEPLAMEAFSVSAAAGAPLSVSPISAWEIGMLAMKERIVLRAKPHRWFADFCALPGLALADMSPSILIDASFLPEPVHPDPADRISPIDGSV